MSSASISEIVAALESHGVKFRVEGKELVVRLPKNSPPDVIAKLEILRDSKAAIRKLVESGFHPACGSTECGGCYELWPGGPKLHPPKCSLEWLRWRERWDKVRQ
jgi:hypothetical protein